MAVSPNLDKGFRDLMTETVTYAARSGQNEYNEPTYGTPVSYTARIVGKSMELRDAKGEETTVTYELWLDTVDIISPLGQLTLSGAKWIDTTPEIFTVRRVPDENGDSHIQVSCGWRYHRQGRG
tara:strand:- start:6680 stop:7051 length:372 start_codon:yes stop_codon:yes gene_type:complete